MNNSSAENEIITEEGLRKRDQYLERLRALYDNAREWIKGTNLHFEDVSFELNEEELGRYTAPGLRARDEREKKIFTMEPIGALNVGAEGRVDVIGLATRESILYMVSGGPPVTVISGLGGVSERRERPMFRGVDQPGWYWIPEVRRSRARPMDREALFDIIDVVSDYDCRI